MVRSSAPTAEEGCGDETRRAKRKIRDPGELEDVIRRAEVCRLGMVDVWEPYIVPMNFRYRDGRLYLHCAREGRELGVLRANPRVCFELEAGVRKGRGRRRASGPLPTRASSAGGRPRSFWTRKG